MSHNKPYDTGVSKEKSNISLQKVGTEDIKYQSPMNSKNSENKHTNVSSTLVFRLGNNKETLIDKSNSYNQSTQNIQSFQTLEAELTSKEKDSNGFWKESLRELSKKLWYPKKTDLHDLDLSYLNGFSKNTVQSSFQIVPMTNKNHHKKNFQRILWLSSQCSPPDTMEKENIIYSRKIRIYPTKHQKELFEECFRATRFIWNNALEYIQNNPNTSKTHISLRRNTMLNDKKLDLDEHRHMRWLKNIPYDTRQLTLKQLASNFKTNFTLLKHKKIKFFEMKFKSKKNPYQCFFVDKNALDLHNLRIFKRRLKHPFKMRNRMKKWVSKNNCESDFIVKREKNRYYLCLPMKKASKKQPETRLKFQHQPYTRVALDPGVRTFQTFYSDQGIAGKIGDSICEKIIDIGLLQDKLQSKIKKINSKRTRYNMKKRCFLLRTKIKNIVNDLHWKTCHYLCSTFKHILLPSFDVSNMIRKDIPERARKIRSKTVRQMLSLSHYAFKEKLKYKAECLGCRVDIVNESFTTKTCPDCGTLKNMGGLKIYQCKECGFELDRDYNGARNIFLKYL